jgi:hypothetical protein
MARTVSFFTASAFGRANFPHTTLPTIDARSVEAALAALSETPTLDVASLQLFQL